MRKFFIWLGGLTVLAIALAGGFSEPSTPSYTPDTTSVVSSPTQSTEISQPPILVVDPKTTDSYWKLQTFTYGETSDNVRHLQDFLKTKGYFPAGTASTGYFGPTTNLAYSKLTGYTLRVPSVVTTSSSVREYIGGYPVLTLDEIRTKYSDLLDGTVDSSPTYGCAENGSCYGDINEFGVPKTIYVDGYYRKDGTYVRGHYRGAPRY